MHIHCKTERAVLLLGLKDERGVLFFPHDPTDKLPGLEMRVTAAVPINVQLIEFAGTVIGKNAKVEIIQDYSDEIPDSDCEGGGAITVYLATCDILAEKFTTKPLSNLPDLIRKSGKGRARVILMKAMQIFSGALTQNTKAVDFDEAIRHFDK